MNPFEQIESLEARNAELELRLAEYQAQEPIYQIRSGDGKWVDQSKNSYEYNLYHGQDVRVVFKAPINDRDALDKYVANKTADLERQLAEAQAREEAVRALIKVRQHDTYSCRLFADSLQAIVGGVGTSALQSAIDAAVSKAHAALFSALQTMTATVAQYVEDGTPISRKELRDLVRQARTALSAKQEGGDA